MPTMTMANPGQNGKRAGASAPTLNAAEFNQLIVDLTALLETASSQEDFFAAYLEKVMEISGAAGVAVWQRNPGGQIQLLHEFNLGALNLESIPNGVECHGLVLEEAALSRRGHWIAPAAPQDNAKLIKVNLSPLALLLAPIVVEEKVVGLLELFLAPDQERESKRFLTRLATELAGFAAAFFHKRQWKQLQDQQQLWQNLEAFAAQVHQSLNPREVAYLAANDGKRLVECDQLSVARRRGAQCEVLSVSGAVTVESKSPLVQALQALMAAVAGWGETLVYQGTRDETLPPAVLTALDAYLSLSNSRLLVALPLADTRLQGPERMCGVLVAESFDAAMPLALLRQRLEFVARHVGPALCNALVVERMPLQWLTRPLAALQRDLGSKRRFRLVTFAAVMAALAAFLALFPLPLRSQATGQLVPEERRVVYSTINGKIVHLAAKQGDQVEKGQELLFIADLDTQLKVDQLSAKVSALGQKLNILEEHLSKPLSTKERSEYLNERIRVQYDLGKAKVERNLLLTDNRSPRKSPVASPLAGQVLTFDAKEKLLGKTVKVGDPLLRLAATDGPWEVELFIPEREAGLLRGAMVRSGAAALDVDLLIANDPHRVYKGTIRRGSLGGETTIRNDKVVLPARVTITDRGLSTQLAGMPVGVEVHARIHLGTAAAGYVWFNEAWTFIYEKFLF